jgi:hypothetical protein
MCHPDYFYGILHIPLLTVYDNGRILFKCPDEREETETLCQNRVAPDRIQKLLADIHEAGQDYLYKGEYPPEVGPQNFITLIISTANDTIRVKWSTASHTMPLRSVVENLDSFIEEVQAGRQVYEPEYVALWIKRPVDCSSSIDSFPCSSISKFPTWPFDFAPPYQQLEQIYMDNTLEFPQPFSAIRSSMPDLSREPPGSEFYFRDGNTILSFYVRPYLPQEVMQIRATRSQTYTLPFYAFP